MNAIIDSIDEKLYQQIKEAIASKDSVVGIDAVHTHILILHKLMQLEEQIQEIKEKLATQY